MVDRVYLKSLPKFKKSLQNLKADFSAIKCKTDWVGMRVDPLLQHLAALEATLNSEDFSLRSTRLTKGVAMFHSDLVYFRTNIKELERILASERMVPT